MFKTLKLFRPIYQLPKIQIVKLPNSTKLHLIRSPSTNKKWCSTDTSLISISSIEIRLAKRIFSPGLLDYIINNRYNQTPLQFAIYQKLPQKDINTVIDEFEYCCLPEHIDKYYPYNTALLVACRLNFKEVANKLIDTFDIRCSPDYANQDGETSLYWSCSEEMEDFAIKLIDKFGKKSMPHIVTVTGETPLIKACMYGLTNLVKKLVDTFGQDCNPGQFDMYHKCALYYAYEQQYTDIVKILLNKYGKACIGNRNE
jgi:ankyrin repeat protein